MSTTIGREATVPPKNLNIVFFETDAVNLKEK